MSRINSLSFIEVLKSEIKEEINNYRSALNSNKEFWELRQIKEKIKRLQNTLDTIMNNLRNYTPENAAQ